MVEVTQELTDKNECNYSKYLGSGIYYQNLVSSNCVLPSFDAMTQDTKNTLISILDTVSDQNKQLFDSQIESVEFNMGEKNDTALKSMLYALYIAAKPEGIKERYRKSNAFLAEADNIKKLKDDCLNSPLQIKEYYYNFGLIYLKLDLVDEGMALIEEAVSMDNNFGLAHVVLALIYTLNEQWSEGEDHAREAIRLGSNLGPDLMDLCLMSCTFNQGKKVETSFKLETIIDNAPVDINGALGMLPPIQGDSLDHSESGKNIVFVSCDDAYFHKLFKPLLFSIYETNPDWAVHIHVVNPSDKVQSDIDKFKQQIEPMLLYYTYEQFELPDRSFALTYYSCARFCRLYQMVAANKNKVMMLDADVLVRDKFEKLAGMSDDTDIALSLWNKGDAPLWSKIHAGCTYYKRSDSSLPFLRKVALCILHNFKAETSRWFLDQVALVFAYEYLDDKNSALLVDGDTCSDIYHSDTSVIWQIVNKISNEKYDELSQRIIEEYGL